ncbi:MAG: hypothetical protein JW867_03180 [Candidatus Omnitrophica bacterium]|nr:hypothetical protein [Candidatus Omnitrophota bacterium]
MNLVKFREKIRFALQFKLCSFKEGNNDQGFCQLLKIMVIAPLLTIIFSYIFDTWDWGLMDDMWIIHSGTNALTRSLNLFRAMLNFGQFRLTFAVYAGFFYSIFKNYPVFFYIFKALVIYMVLFLWGRQAYKITKRRLTVLLFMGISLSFHYLYDAFFYLSSHEFLGLFFVALSFNFFLQNLESILGGDFSQNHDKPKNYSLKSYALAVFFLFLAYGSKEQFTSCGLAFGFSYLYLAFKLRKEKCSITLLQLGLLLIIGTFAYGAALLNIVKSHYTSTYAFNPAKFVSTFKNWLKKDFINHLPWIGAVIFITNICQRRARPASKSKPLALKKQWAVCLSLSFYIFFLIVLLPWNTISYYATPFAVFFAFFAVLIISQPVLNCNLKFQAFIVISAMIFNQLVCEYALARESSYQRDTAGLLKWLKKDDSIRNIPAGYSVHSNAAEPAGAITRLANMKWNLGIESFVFSVNPDRPVEEKEAKYYLYSPRFQKINMGRLKNWNIVFFNDNWVMFKRP